jgi:hypothetical protein
MSYPPYEHKESFRDKLPVAWSSRGVGCDSTPGCFVCGGRDGLYSNICAWIHKTDEQRALDCFARGARMGYYHGDMAVPQIKVGACARHLKALEHLSEQWFISRDRVDDLVRWQRMFNHREDLIAAHRRGEHEMNVRDDGYQSCKTEQCPCTVSQTGRVYPPEDEA